MSLGIANAVAGATQPPQGGASGPIETPSEKNADAAVLALKAYNQPDPSGASVKTERADAVQATPTSAPATVVDFNKERPAGDQMPQYPISGPDQFAKSMAVRNAEPTEEAPAPPRDDIERVADLEKRAAEVKEATSGGAGDIEPVEKSWEKQPGPAKAEPLEASAKEQERLDAESITAGGGGLNETTAEAGEARLTE